MAAKAKTISVEDAVEQLTELRSGRGGRRSKYEDILDALDGMGKNEVYPSEVEGYSQVSSLRNSIQRRFDDEFVVKSSKAKEDAGKDQSEATYKVFIFHKDAAEKI